MESKTERILRYAGSPAVSLLFLSLMGGLIYANRMYKWEGSLDYMVLLASVLFYQILVAIALRVERFKRGGAGRLSRKLLKAGPVKAGSVSAELLRKNGFKEHPDNIDSSVAAFTKTSRLANAVEILFFLLLLSALVLAIINIGYSLDGYTGIFQGSEWMKLPLNIKFLQKGFLYNPEGIGYEVRTDNLGYTYAGEPAILDLQVRKSGETELVTIPMRAGEVIELGNTLMRYTGDFYTAYIQSVRGEHGLQTTAFKLTNIDGGKEYYGRLPVGDRAYEAEGWFNPETEVFRIHFYNKGETEPVARIKVQYPGYGIDGEFLANIASLGHYGTLHFHLPDRRPLIMKLFYAALSVLVLRLFIRNKTVWATSREGKVLFYTNSREVRKTTESSSA